MNFQNIYLILTIIYNDEELGHEYIVYLFKYIKVRKRAMFRDRYNQALHLTQDTNGKVTTSQLDITNESQKVSLFSAGDHKASINRRARKHVISLRTDLLQL